MVADPEQPAVAVATATAITATTEPGDLRMGNMMVDLATGEHLPPAMHGSSTYRVGDPPDDEIGWASAS